jgi:hypothetical protein
LCDVKEFLKEIIFRKHSYLLYSKALNSWEKPEFSKWCDEEWDEEKVILKYCTV